MFGNSAKVRRPRSSVPERPCVLDVVDVRPQFVRTLALPPSLHPVLSLLSTNRYFRYRIRRGSSHADKGGRGEGDARHGARGQRLGHVTGGRVRRRVQLRT